MKKLIIMMEEKKHLFLPFQKLEAFASAPIRKTSGSAGLDLASAYDATIPPNAVGRIKTEICVKIPDNCVGYIAARSGFSFNHNCNVLGGIIDSDYEGELVIQLTNLSNTNPLEITKGDRIAQLLCIPIEYPVPLLTKISNNTARGSAGLGSTGMR